MFYCLYYVKDIYGYVGGTGAGREIFVTEWGGGYYNGRH